MSSQQELRERITSEIVAALERGDVPPVAAPVANVRTARQRRYRSALQRRKSPPATTPPTASRVAVEPVCDGQPVAPSRRGRGRRRPAAAAGAGAGARRARRRSVWFGAS